MPNPSPSDSPTAAVALSPDDLAILTDCRNEVLNGFAVQNFERILGCSRPVATRLLSTLHKAASASVMQSPELSRTDLALLSKAIRMTVVELGVEFAIRTGFTPLEAETLASHIEAISS